MCRFKKIYKYRVAHKLSSYSIQLSKELITERNIIKLIFGNFYLVLKIFQIKFWFELKVKKIYNYKL